MDIKALGKKFSWLPPGLLKALEKRAVKIPAVSNLIASEGAEILDDLRSSLKPYQGEGLSLTHLPAEGLDQALVISEMKSLSERESERWQDGFVSGAVYHGDPTYIAFLNQVYALNSQSNPLHADVWPSAAKFESEIISMTAHMLGASRSSGSTPGGSASSVGTPGAAEICGSVSSGGTESILLAMKAYRDWAREAKGIRNPNMVAPSTAHAAFDKAALYFNIGLVKVPVGQDYRADVDAMRRAVDRNTIVMVGSAPSFPHGVIDPIEELSALAAERGIGFHTDACLGGFVLPWARKLGYPVPAFDFSLPGVTSISVDTHKYGYAAKGSSVILYRGKALRHHQYYATSTWPGGLYTSPTFAGSRAGALSAVCWAALVSIGEAGYLEYTKRILETGARVKIGIHAIPELRVLGNPLWVIAFSAPELNIYQIMDVMGRKGWSLNGLFDPPAIHLAITLRHTQPGVAERFIEDLKDAVKIVKENPQVKGDMAPIYGMSAGTPFKGMVEDFLKLYLDVLYETHEE